MDPELGHGNAELGQEKKEENVRCFENIEMDGDELEEDSSDSIGSSEDSCDEEECTENTEPSPSPPPRRGFGDRKLPTHTGGDIKIHMDNSLVLSSATSLTQPVYPASRNSPFFSPSSFSNPKHFGPKKPGQLKIIESILRISSIILSLVTMSVMVATHETRTAAGSTFDVKFSDFQAYNYLVALSAISVVYSSIQLILIAYPSNVNSSSPIKLGLCVYLCDQMLACLLFSASSSAATASELSRHGLRHIWPPACSTWGLWLFCSKADAAVVIGFFASLSVMMSSLLSGFYLSRLLAE